MTTSRDGLAVGDTTTVVITSPNGDSDRDPVTQIDGVTTFVRYQDDVTPEFGAAERVRVADIGDSHMVVVALDRDD